MIKSSRLSNVLLVLLAVAVCWACVCTMVGATVPVWRTLCRISPYVLAFTIFNICLSFSRNQTEKILYVILCLYTLAECGLGTAQLAGWAQSRHALYHLTGNFMNPAPYACFLAFAAVCCVVKLLRRANSVSVLILTWMTLAWSTVMVGIACSRAAWLGLVLALFVIVFKEADIRNHVKWKGLIISCLILAFVAGCFAAWMMKPDSALVRFYIWQIDCRAIGDHPFFGVGQGAEMGAFADAQIDFFHSHTRDLNRQLAASMPQNPFNEFLKMGMCFGVPGLLLAVAIFMIALFVNIRNRRISAYASIVLGVFSCFSFPFSHMILSMTLTFVIADATSDSEWLDNHRKATNVVALLLIVAALPFVWGEFQHKKELRTIVKETPVVSSLEPHYDQLSDEMLYLCLYIKALCQEKRYPDAITQLHRLMRFTGDSQYPVLLGQTCQRIGDVSGAANAYLRAYYMAPSRLMPLYMLMNLYASCGLTIEAEETREYALSIPVSEKHTSTLEVRRLIQDYQCTQASSAPVLMQF